MPDGLLNVLKPPGMTSHDVVDAVRRITRMRKIGHAGTLDPAAAGVMILMLGGTTRLSEYLMGCDKTYRAEITIGLSTDTLDGEGVVVAEADASLVTEEQVRDALAEMVGEMEMVPPMHSAVWHEGRRLYDIARAGETVEVKAREVTVHSFDLLGFHPGERARAMTEVSCSSGTYVRSLAAMLGEALDCPAYLSFLVRTKVGAQGVANSLTGRELISAMRADRLGAVMQAPATVLCGWPTIDADLETATQLCRGMRTPAPSLLPIGQLLLVMSEGRLLCVAQVVTEGENTCIQPRRVLLSEDEL